MIMAEIEFRCGLCKKEIDLSAGFVIGVNELYHSTCMDKKLGKYYKENKNTPIGIKELKELLEKPARAKQMNLLQPRIEQRKLF